MKYTKEEATTFAEIAFGDEGRLLYPESTDPEIIHNATVVTVLGQAIIWTGDIDLRVCKGRIPLLESILDDKITVMDGDMLIAYPIKGA